MGSQCKRIHWISNYLVQHISIYLCMSLSWLLSAENNVSTSAVITTRANQLKVLVGWNPSPIFLIPGSRDVTRTTLLLKQTTVLMDYYRTWTCFKFPEYFTLSDNDPVLKEFCFCEEPLYLYFLQFEFIPRSSYRWVFFFNIFNLESIRNFILKVFLLRAFLEDIIWCF